MKKLKSTKLGFTIVELVIVMALIAILAAVLIPLFANVIRTATISADMQLVHSLNIILEAEGQIEGRNPTMHDAVLDAFENGYIVEKLTPTTTDCDILWNQDTDRFVLAEQNGFILFSEDKSQMDTPTKIDTNQYKYWKVYDKDHPVPAADEQTYSVYLNYVPDEMPTFTVGVDVGYHDEIKALIYDTSSLTASKEVLIRTYSNDTDLYVNGYVNDTDPKIGDTIKHYGQAGYLEVIKCAMASYHEFGYIPAAVISEGRIVNEAGEVKLIDGEVENVGVQFLYIDTIDTNEFGAVTVAVADGGIYPEFDRADVVIKPTGTLVVTLEVLDGNDEVADSNDLWLFRAGVKDQIVVAKTENRPADGKIATVTPVEGKEVRELKGGFFMLSNSSGVSASNTKAAYEIANKYSGSGTVDVNGVQSSDELEIEERPSKEDVLTGRKLFAGGTGTEDNPFLIKTAEQLYNLSNPDIIFEGFCFELLNDIDTTKYDWAPIGIARYKQLPGGVKELMPDDSEYFWGTVYGNNHTIKVKFSDETDALSYFKGENTSIAFFAYTYWAEIYDLNLDVDINITDVDVASAGVAGTAQDSYFENVTVNGSIITGSTASGFANINYGSKFVNCTNNADICVIRKVATDYNYSFVAGFTAQATSWDTYCCEYTNCTNNGNLSYIKENDAIVNYAMSMGAIIGQVGDHSTLKAQLIDCENNGSITGWAKNNSERYEGYSTRDKVYTFGEGNSNKYKELVGGKLEAGVSVTENGNVVDLTRYLDGNKFKCGE